MRAHCFKYVLRKSYVAKGKLEKKIYITKTMFPLAMW